METTKEYIVVVDGRPVFSAVNACTIPCLVDDVKSRVGDGHKIEVFVQTTEPYAFGSDDGE